MNNRTRITTGILSFGLVGALALTGCAASDEADGDSRGTIELVYTPGWTDGLTMSYLLEDQFTKLGYDVELNKMTDNGPMFAGLANGDFDMYPSAWPVVTQKSYVDAYADDLEDLGAYFDEGVLTVAVPTYSDIDSIDELLAHADDFGGKIYTIEPGAGTSANAEDNLFPAYGLGEEYELVTSSTAGMLSVLERSIAAGDDVAITLWHPFWANDVYDVKDLEDPKNAMGDPETLNFLGHAGFSDEFPDAAELVAQIKLESAQYAELENTVVNEYGEGKEAEAIDAWIVKHADDFDWIIE